MTNYLKWFWLKADRVLIISLGSKIHQFKIPTLLRFISNGWLTFRGNGLEIHFGHDGEGSYRVLKIGGYPQEPYGTGSEYDCSGRTFCRSVRSYLRGFITIGFYAIDI